MIHEYEYETRERERYFNLRVTMLGTIGFSCKLIFMVALVVWRACTLRRGVRERKP